MITILHRGGYGQKITVLHREGGVYRDPRKWLRNLWMTPNRVLIQFDLLLTLLQFYLWSKSTHPTLDPSHLCLAIKRDPGGKRSCIFISRPQRWNCFLAGKLQIEAVIIPQVHTYTCTVYIIHTYTRTHCKVNTRTHVTHTRAPDRGCHHTSCTHANLNGLEPAVVAPFGKSRDVKWWQAECSKNYGDKETKSFESRICHVESFYHPNISLWKPPFCVWVKMFWIIRFANDNLHIVYF